MTENPNFCLTSAPLLVPTLKLNLKMAAAAAQVRQKLFTFEMYNKPCDVFDPHQGHRRVQAGDLHAMRTPLTVVALVIHPEFRLRVHG